MISYNLFINNIDLSVYKEKKLRESKCLHFLS